MRRVVYPGTFDPVTYGHIDIVNRAVELFDEVVVTVATNPAKTNMFTVEERLEMLSVSLKDIDNVVIDSCEGLVVDHANRIGAVGGLRGCREPRLKDWRAGTSEKMPGRPFSTEGYIN